MEQAVDELTGTISTSTKRGYIVFSGITSAIQRKLEEKAATLTAARKQRGKALPENLASPEEVKTYKQIAVNNSIHSASVPGITALDLRVLDYQWAWAENLG